MKYVGKYVQVASPASLNSTPQYEWVWEAQARPKKHKKTRWEKKEGYAEFLAICGKGTNKYADRNKEKEKFIIFSSLPTETQKNNFFIIYEYRNRLKATIEKLNEQTEMVKLRGSRISVGQNGQLRVTGGDIGCQVLLLKTAGNSSNNSDILTRIEQDRIYFYCDKYCNIKIACQLKEKKENLENMRAPGPRTRNSSLIVVKKIWGEGGERW